MLFLLPLLLMFIQPSDVLAAMQPKQKIMENGLTVLLIERHSLPLVSLVALVKSGSAQDPADRAGTANFTASMLDEGTTARTSTQIAEELDFMGASLSVSASNDYTTAHLRVLTKHLEKGSNLFSDVLLNPRFDSKEVERVRKLIAGAIYAEDDDPMAVAARALDKLIFGSHPYGHAVIGQTETIEKITQEDLVRFHKTHFSPDNTLLAIVGDITEKEADQLVKKHFSAWTAQPSKERVGTPPPLPPAEKRFIEKTLTQSSIRMGHVGISRKNPDFYPVVVMNYILGGGGFSSRLLKTIRDDQGLVYSVSSSFDTHQQPGSFLISMQTQTANTERAIAAAIEEVKRIQTEPVSETELAEAKAYLVGSFPLRLETAHGLADLLAQVGFYELGQTYFEDYPRQIGNVTQDDVLRVAKAYLHPDRFQLVVVGSLAEAKIGQP